MRSIGNVTLTQELARHVKLPKGTTTTPARIGAEDAYPVRSFRGLVEHTARLAILNKDCVFFFRGQSIDYRHQGGSSTLYPTIYRGASVGRFEIRSRFALLRAAGSALSSLVQKSGLEGKDDIRKQLVQWSLLQHYEVCSTPLLDLTSSLRVACSFALLEPSPPEPTVYLCGLPYTSGRISVNSEHDTVNVRLVGICPPDALRPLLQDGHVAGTYDVEDEYDTRNKTSLDLVNRLVAKFRIPDTAAFRAEVAAFGAEDLYPPDDPLMRIADEVRSRIAGGDLPEQVVGDGTDRQAVSAADLGYFLEAWTRLEQLVLGSVRKAGKDGEDVRSMAAAIQSLKRLELIGRREPQLMRLVALRNQVVHRPESVSAEALRQTRSEIESLLDWASEIYSEVARRPRPWQD